MHCSMPAPHIPVPAAAAGAMNCPSRIPPPLLPPAPPCSPCRRHHTQAQLKAVVLAVAVAEAAGEILPWQELDTPDELMAAQPQVPTAWLAAHQAWQQQHPGEEPGAKAAAAGSQQTGKRGAAAGVAGPSSHVHSSTCGCSASSNGGDAASQAGNAASPGPGSSSEADGAAPSSSQEQQQPQQSDTGQPDTAAAAAAVAVASGLPPMLAPGVVSSRWYPELGATELLLVNGMRVTLKTTDYFRDEVLITGVAAGGLSEVRGQKGVWRVGRMPDRGQRCSRVDATGLVCMLMNRFPGSCVSQSGGCAPFFGPSTAL
jgi:hypothetical protein